MPTVVEREQVIITGTNPAANVEVVETVPAGTWWELLCITVQLVQGATQTPQPILILDDGTTTLYAALGSTTAQSASTTVRYNWAPHFTTSGLIGSTPNINTFAPVPERFVLGPGYRIQTSTVGKGANSDYGAPIITVRRSSAAP